jgi:hypothetical protein
MTESFLLVTITGNGAEDNIGRTTIYGNLCLAISDFPSHFSDPLIASIGISPA